MAKRIFFMVTPLRQWDSRMCIPFTKVGNDMSRPSNPHVYIYNIYPSFQKTIVIMVFIKKTISLIWQMVLYQSRSFTVAMCGTNTRHKYESPIWHRKTNFFSPRALQHHLLHFPFVLGWKPLTWQLTLWKNIPCQEWNTYWKARVFWRATRYFIVNSLR